MTTPKPPAPKVLFDDEYTILNEDGVHIRTYYFPFGQCKEFNWSDVESVATEEASFFNTKSWGSNQMYRWWGCQMFREFDSTLKHLVTFKLKGQSWQPCVTPPNGQVSEFVRICQEQIARHPSTPTPTAATK